MKRKQKRATYHFIGFRPTEEMSKELRRLAAEREVKISQLVREAVKRLLKAA